MPYLLDFAILLVNVLLLESISLKPTSLLEFAVLFTSMLLFEERNEMPVSNHILGPARLDPAGAKPVFKFAVLLLSVLLFE